MHIPESPKEVPFFERASVKDFIKFRKILPEDFPLLEELSKLSRSFVIGAAHNFFMGYGQIATLEKAQEKAKRELQRAIDTARDEQEKVLYRGLLHFVEKYDWTVALSLEAILERGGETR